jgi:proteasome lid subunit RPN8/RPN11
LSTPFRLLLPLPIQAELLAQARAEAPNECCGLLAGTFVTVDPDARLGRVELRFPLINAVASPVRFLSDSKSMFAAMRTIRERGLEVLAIYHSHPTTAPIPSRTDLMENWSERVINLIVSLAGEQPTMKSWWLDSSGYRPAEMEITS